MAISLCLKMVAHAEINIQRLTAWRVQSHRSQRGKKILTSYRETFIPDDYMAGSFLLGQIHLLHRPVVRSTCALTTDP